MRLIENPVLPTTPKSKKELLRRIPNLYGNKYLILPECGGGTGAPGYMTELLLGSQGKNNAFGDTVGVELKWKSKKPTPLTLFHCEINPNGYPTANAALVPLLQEYGYYKKKDGELRWCHLVSEKSQKFAVDQIQLKNDDKKIVLSTTDGYEVFWYENDLLQAASKLKNLILISGSCTKKDQQGRIYLSLESAKHLTNFRFNQFLNLIKNRDVMIDFDFREDRPGEIFKQNPVLRNHGTKFRIRLKKLHLLWESIKEIH